MDLCSISDIKTLLTEAGAAPKKKYGQNFLVNAAVPHRIACECADTPERLILEIGPGIGCLTRELAQIYDAVVAVEIDRSLIPILGKTLSDCANVEVVNADVMELDLCAFLAQRACGREVSVAANLPYYITTPILMKLLESGAPLSSITVMVQSEVADRLTAEAGSADYGAISAAIAYYGRARRLFSVSAGNFYPPPKIDSAVVRIDMYRERPVTPKDEKLLFSTIRAAFGQRRKTLVNALGAVYGSRLDKSGIAAVVEEVTGDPSVRGERLSIAEFVALSDALERRLECM